MMQTQVGNLTVEELKLLIRETVSETLSLLLIEHDLIDPDAGKQIRPEFATGLRKAIQQAEVGKTHSAEAVAEKLGFNWNEL